ncbi:hypothetical protein AMTR_s00150p00095860 [Amborella trichopoda]|uniref:Uncharacterized protein n=1 Tax=Amborella trichopoda TaxID=13333 RepID=W1PL19_AMBTC|nr:hypothetical protein AMTR_s00150p00095860 [Amborella trichopoda]
MAAKEVLDAGLLLDPKSRKIAVLRKIVVRLHREVEHHQNMSDLYRGKVERVKELLASMRRKLARVSRSIDLGE